MMRALLAGLTAVVIVRLVAWAADAIGTSLAAGWQ